MAQWAKLMEPEPEGTAQARPSGDCGNRPPRTRSPLICGRVWRSLTWIDSGVTSSSRMTEAGRTAAARRWTRNGFALIDVCFGKYLQYYGSKRFGSTAPDPETCTLPAAAPSFSPPVPAKVGIPLQPFRDKLRDLLGDRARRFRSRLRPGHSGSERCGSRNHGHAFQTGERGREARQYRHAGEDLRGYRAHARKRSGEHRLALY